VDGATAPFEIVSQIRLFTFVQLCSA